MEFHEERPYRSYPEEDYVPEHELERAQGTPGTNLDGLVLWISSMHPEEEGLSRGQALEIARDVLRLIRYKGTTSPKQDPFAEEVPLFEYTSEGAQFMKQKSRQAAESGASLP